MAATDEKGYLGTRVCRRRSRTAAIGLVLVALLPVVLAGGCSGNDCNGSEGGLRVRLRNGASGSACTGTVTIDQGDERSVLSCTVEGADCICEGAKGQPGTYFVSVSRGGSAIGSANATVEKGSCEPVPLEFGL